MSDFLDRLAARAIGSGAALAPRLPSLFEPLPRAPVMPPADESEAPARAREASPAVPPVPDVAPPPRAPTHARESIEPRAARVAPVERPALPTTAGTAADVPHAPMPSPPRAASPVRAIGAEQASTPPTPERPAVTSSFAFPRPPRVARTRRETASAPAPNGVLLAAPAPVFASTGAASTRSERTVAARAAAARAEGKADAAREPVVHVSIGRLEVRATPAAAAPPRRRDGPQPGSLDDYLRQRDKASP